MNQKALLLIRVRKFSLGDKTEKSFTEKNYQVKLSEKNLMFVFTKK